MACTLGHYYQSLIATRQLAASKSIVLKIFIEIVDVKSSTAQIHIGLDVNCIDEPTIRKTMIMVHNYIKLHAGRKHNKVLLQDRFEQITQTYNNRDEFDVYIAGPEKCRA